MEVKMKDKMKDEIRHGHTGGIVTSTLMTRAVDNNILHVKLEY
jgi:hypothetical protein